MKDKLGNELPAIPAGHSVHPKMWEFRAKLELAMLKIFILSNRTPRINPITGNRTGRLPMQVNSN